MILLHYKINNVLITTYSGWSPIQNHVWFWHTFFFILLCHVLIVFNELNQIKQQCLVFSQSPFIYLYDSHEALLRFSGKTNKTQKLKKDEYFFKKLFLLYKMLYNSYIIKIITSLLISLTPPNHDFFSLPFFSIQSLFVYIFWDCILIHSFYMTKPYWLHHTGKLLLY